MNLQKLFLIALLGAAVSATTLPTLGKVLGFGHTAAYAQEGQGGNASGDSAEVDEPGDSNHD